MVQHINRIKYLCVAKPKDKFKLYLLAVVKWLKSELQLKNETNSYGLK